MKKTIYPILLSAVTAMLPLASCVKDRLFNTPHTDKGAVVVTPTWESAQDEIDLDLGMVIPDSCRVFADGVETAGKALYTPGQHTLFLYNEAEGIDIDGHIATLKRNEDGTPCAVPGFLFSRTMEIDVPQDDILRVDVPMAQRVCAVSVQINLEGDNMDNVEQVSATLDGIAGSMDILRNEMLGESVSLLAVSSVSESTPEALCLDFHWRVFGIIPTEKQIITLRFKMKDGMEMSEPADISEYLQEVDKMKPVKLTSTMQPPQDGDFSGSIKDWETVDGGDVSAR